MQQIGYYYLTYLAGNMTKMYHILDFTRDPSTVALYWRNTTKPFNKIIKLASANTIINSLVFELKQENKICLYNFIY